MNKHLSKVVRTIASLQVAIILLILIASYVVIGTLIPQHSAPNWYLEAYPAIGETIVVLSLDHAYSSPIFIVLVLLFAINLTACTMLSLRGQLKQTKPDYFPGFTHEDQIITDVPEEDAIDFCTKKHFAIHQDHGESGFRASRFRWGVLGAAITHLGILILFVGGVIGNMMASEDVVSMLPGNEVSYPEEGFVIRLDDFHMTFEEEGAVKQYISDVTLIDDDGTETQHTLWVNNPLSHKGKTFYQASFGWTGNLKMTDTETEEVVIEGLLRSGRTYFHQPSHLTVYLYDYYPEMAIGHEQQPVSLSNREVNPYYAVVLYQFGEPIGSYMIAPGDPIIFENLSITFTHSVAYTGLLVRSDPSYPVVLIGFIIILIGMFVSFYCYPRFIRYHAGTVTTASGKNGWVFHHGVKQFLAKHDQQQNKE